ncbi:MAG: 5-formyltetrahydrofolate cyclo-ligase [Anaerolineae bacterium]|nr:5-formyltetrahydrofolate cyclo-ligase [Anaerolineae bacterium]
MNKSEARALVWEQLRKVAVPDSRFHLDFNEYIPDFEGSDLATGRLCDLALYRQAEVLFITPDNCLEQLRARAVRDRKIQIISTYGIRRGLVELLPERVPAGHEAYAGLLDALEKLGQNLSLAELRSRYSKIDVLVTGGSAVSTSGIRFGKGHGFFDLEWAFLYEMGLVNTETPVVAFVHDCQVVDLELETSPHDTLCDLIVTPTRVIRIDNAPKPTAGVLWDKLEAGMIEDIPPLQELHNQLTL